MAWSLEEDLAPPCAAKTQSSYERREIGSASSTRLSKCDRAPCRSLLRPDPHCAHSHDVLACRIRPDLSVCDRAPCLLHSLEASDRGEAGLDAAYVGPDLADPATSEIRVSSAMSGPAAEM